ncbi:hypothetical protein KAR26_00265, partial [Candidatus Parcubacteria bacterium]|nr:hypothetical protein [Candidatus Parcubacteria bacterium]
ARQWKRWGGVAAQRQLLDIGIFFEKSSYFIQKTQPFSITHGFLSASGSGASSGGPIEQEFPGVFQGEKNFSFPQKRVRCRFATE